MNKFFLLFTLFSILIAKQDIMEKDYHSFSNSHEVIVKHLQLDLDVNFEKKILSGNVVLTIQNKTKATELILDTRDLQIDKITLDNKKTPTEFSLGSEVKYLGKALTIKIKPNTKKVCIIYSTSPPAAALQWLEPSQTAGKTSPFLFTQSEAILARTWVPCQDGPGVRFTYSATIRTPKNMLAVMSASGNSNTKSSDGIYHFNMSQPIPSYLLALAVGDLSFRKIGKRTGVYAEPSMIDKAAYEFGDMEKMVKAAENLYGPYRWDRYDIIVLPPSFPYGGMENPRLTFATPTVITGDRSLVSIVAHELAHSWSGNLVTNATWDDFWLNEGFTVYFEQRIMEKLYGRTYSEMLAVLILKDLNGEIKNLGGPESPDTKLKLALKDRDPDDGMTDIAYNKGYFFLRLCEETFGRKQWDTFLKKYFNEHAFTSMTTEKFLDYWDAYFHNKKAKESINANAWIYSPGLPSNCPQPTSEEFDKVQTQLDAFLGGSISAAQLNTKDWSTHHWLFFLSRLPDPLDLKKLIELDYAANLSRSTNPEILSEWFVHCIKARYETAYGPMKNFLMTVGRRKLIKPLYTELAKTIEGKAWAKDVYEKARPSYHSISSNTIDDILK